MADTNDPASKPPRQATAPAAHRDGLSLSGAFVRGGNDHIELTYAVQSTRTTPAYLLNALYRMVEGRPRISTDLIYVYMEGDRAHFHKDLEPLPEGVDVYQPESPYARRLGPGDVFEETIVVPTPLKEYRAYPVATQTPRRHAGQEVHVVNFQLGYVLWTTGASESLSHVDGVEVAMVRPAHGQASNPHGVLGFSQRLTVPVATA